MKSFGAKLAIAVALPLLVFPSLQARLRAAAPGRSIEVVNLGVTATLQLSEVLAGRNGR
jgi:hypothetical protein